MSVNSLGCSVSRLGACCVICAALRRSGFYKQSVWAIKSGYSLDQNHHTLYGDLQRIIKTTAIDAVLREALQSVRGIELAILYGSFAKGEATGRSDLDLMIIGDATDRALALCAMTLQDRPS